MAEAVAPTNAPSGVSATTGDGTMTLTWNSLTEASGGYDFRYSNNAADFFAGDGPTWHDVPGDNNATNTSVTLPFDEMREQKHKLTVGETYYFQVGGKDSDGNAGPAWASISGTQRAAPPAVKNLSATSGNAQVTLTWTDQADYAIVNYEYRQSSDDGSSWTAWDGLTHSVNDVTATGTVSGLSNGTTYSFQVRGTN